MELRFTFYIDARPERVWAAICEGQPIAALMPVEFRSTFKAGTHYAYVGKMPDGNEVEYVHGSILAIEPNQRLEITQTIGTETFESRVTYEFELEAGRYTKLTLINDRFAEADPNYRTNIDGWARFLSNLKSFIETGKVMNFHA